MTQLWVMGTPGNAQILYRKTYTWSLYDLTTQWHLDKFNVKIGTSKKKRLWKRKISKYSKSQQIQANVSLLPKKSESL